MHQLSKVLMFIQLLPHLIKVEILRYLNYRLSIKSMGMIAEFQKDNICPRKEVVVCNIHLGEYISLGWSYKCMMIEHIFYML